MLRHTLDPLPSPFEVKRRIGRVMVHDTKILDLTDSSVLRRLGLRVEDLVSDDLETCQDVGSLAVAAGVHGILAPSAALPGCRTLVLYAPYLKSATTVETSRIQRLPVTIADVAGEVRPDPEASIEMRRLMSRLAREGRDLVRRIRS